MPLHLLSPREVQVASDGDHSDGGGLFLRVKGSNASWVYRYTAPDGRRREMGLGVAERAALATAGESIKRARRTAAENRALLDQRIDPLDMKRRNRSEEKAVGEVVAVAERGQRRSLAQVAREYHGQVVEPKRTTKHAAQWIASLERNIPDALWNGAIGSIDPVELFEALAALQARIPETASRVRQRLDVIFDHAEFYKLCSGNPARIVRRKLAEMPKGPQRGNFAALSFTGVPDFVARLRRQPGNAARALEFALLTAARTGEVLGATWEEIDSESWIWRVPGARMKCGEEHVVFLSPAARSVLEDARGAGSAYLFPSPVDNGRPMSNMAMLTVLRRMGIEKETTVHGVCRASFSTWANETAAARPEVVEACLAHREKDQIRAAYNRAKFNQERQALLKAWANFCLRVPESRVPPPKANELRPRP